MRNWERVEGGNLKKSSRNLNTNLTITAFRLY